MLNDTKTGGAVLANRKTRKGTLPLNAPAVRKESKMARKSKAVETLAAFAERINPRKFNFSPKLVALVGAILGHDYGVRDSRGGRLTSLQITSDGFVVAGSTASDGGGAFIGDAEDLRRNIAVWIQELTVQDGARFLELYAANVNDWRGR